MHSDLEWLWMILVASPKGAPLYTDCTDERARRTKIFFVGRQKLGKSELVTAMKKATK